MELALIRLLLALIRGNSQPLKKIAVVILELDVKLTILLILLVDFEIFQRVKILLSEIDLGSFTLQVIRSGILWKLERKELSVFKKVLMRLCPRQAKKQFLIQEPMIRLIKNIEKLMESPWSVGLNRKVKVGVSLYASMNSQIFMKKLRWIEL